jgi:hypothetical protein
MIGAEPEPMRRAGVVIAAAWVTVIVIALVWGIATARGIPGMLMRWQIEGGDRYSDLPAIVAHLALAGPGIWMLSRHLAATDRVRKRPFEGGAQFRLVARWLFGAATLFGAIGIVCLALAWRAPGYVEPVEIGAAAFARGEYPRDRPVRLWAQPVEGARYAYLILRGRQSDSRRSWLGVRPVDDPSRGPARTPAPDGPVSVFSERSGAARSGRNRLAENRLAETISVSGYVVENGLPGYIRSKLERQGVRIADPHFVLREDEERSFWLVGTGLGLFLSFVLGLIAALLRIRGSAVQGRRPN